jgi:hypothetical protein
LETAIAGRRHAVGPILLILAALSTVASAQSVPDRAIRHFGGRSVGKLDQYRATTAGLQQYLRDSGVRRFTAERLTRPNHADIARKYGFENFVPTQQWWPRGAALALLAEALEKAIEEPITIRNWWRPDRYNRDPRVRGAARSDHVTAHAIDIDYRSEKAAHRAQQWLEQLARTNAWLRLSLGFGPTTTHVGIDSPLGSRRWRYETH